MHSCTATALVRMRLPCLVLRLWLCSPLLHAAHGLARCYMWPSDGAGHDQATGCSSLLLRSVCIFAGILLVAVPAYPDAKSGIDAAGGGTLRPTTEQQRALGAGLVMLQHDPSRCPSPDLSCGRGPSPGGTSSAMPACVWLPAERPVGT